MKDSEGYLLDNSMNEKQPMFFLGNVDDNQSISTIHYALDTGIDLFDTAPPTEQVTVKGS